MVKGAGCDSSRLFEGLEELGCGTLGNTVGEVEDCTGGKKRLSASIAWDFRIKNKSHLHSSTQSSLGPL